MYYPGAANAVYELIKEVANSSSTTAEYTALIEQSKEPPKTDCAGTTKDDYSHQD